MRQGTVARAERDAKLQAAQDRLIRAVERLVTGEDWRRAIEFAARFRSRSFANTLLIHVQHYEAYEAGRVPDPYPAYVAGFRQWVALGRRVTKGQSGYMILAPVTGRFATATPQDEASWRRLRRGESPKPGEQVRSRLVEVRPAYVWDVSQTYGDPIPERPTPALLKGQAPAGLWEGLARVVEESGYRLRQVPNAASLGGANGLTQFGQRVVSVRDDMDDAARVKTLAHELGHLLLHGPGEADDVVWHRGIVEVEAESVALMVGAAHGLDTSGYTVPYVSSWAADVPGKSPVEVVQATAERVRRAALAILNRLDTAQVGTGDPPGLDREPAAGRAAPGAELAARPAASRNDGSSLSAEAS